MVELTAMEAGSHFIHRQWINARPRLFWIWSDLGKLQTEKIESASTPQEQTADMAGRSEKGQ